MLAGPSGIRTVVVLATVLFLPVSAVQFKLGEESPEEGGSHSGIGTTAPWHVILQENSTTSPTAATSDDCEPITFSSVQ